MAHKALSDLPRPFSCSISTSNTGLFYHTAFAQDISSTWNGSSLNFRSLLSESFSLIITPGVHSQEPRQLDWSVTALGCISTVLSS